MFKKFNAIDEIKSEIECLKAQVNRLERDFHCDSHTENYLYIRYNKINNNFDLISWDEFKNSDDEYRIPITNVVKQLLSNSNLIMHLTKSSKEDSMTLSQPPKESAC